MIGSHGMVKVLASGASQAFQISTSKGEAMASGVIAIFAIGFWGAAVRRRIRAILPPK